MHACSYVCTSHHNYNIIDMLAWIATYVIKLYFTLLITCTFSPALSVPLTSQSVSWINHSNLINQCQCHRTNSVGHSHISTVPFLLFLAFLRWITSLLLQAPVPLDDVPSTSEKRSQKFGFLQSSVPLNHHNPPCLTPPKTVLHLKT